MLNPKITMILVSLDSDTTRRSLLAQQIPRYYNSLIHLSAVDGRRLSSLEFHRYIHPYYLRKGKILSPAEVGCFLSHQNALRKFLSSDNEFAFILEDDVILNDDVIDKLFEACKNLPKHSLLIPGGQEGLPSRRFLLGRSTKLEFLFSLHRFSGKHIWRTCCYVLDRVTAQQILDNTIGTPTVADDWRFFFRNSTPFYFYADLIKHPIDLSESHIEVFRKDANQHSVFSFSYLFNLSFRVIKRVVNEILRIVYLLLGYKSVAPHSD